MNDMDLSSTVSGLIGQVVADRFRIESLLGAGAMGVVFRAQLTGARRADSAPLANTLSMPAARLAAGTGETGDRTRELALRSDAAAAGQVALKVVLPDATQQRTVPRLLRGARLAAQVKHPHVVETLAHGRIGPARDGYYVAMELVEGVSFSRLALADLSPGALATLMSQVLDALAHMHARGILHRDIKPDNVLVGRGPSGELFCKISDFGIATETLENATMLTQPGTVIGTPMYMAPEQMQGQARDTPALDLYPIGVMMYELLSGRLPFSGSSLAALMAKISEEAPPLTAREGVVVPDELAEIVMRLVSRLPDDRYLFAADARRALDPFCAPAHISDEVWAELVAADREPAAPALPAGWERGAADLAGGTDDGASAVDDALMPVVGRDDILSALGAIADVAEQGQVRAALLTGCVGLGKSAVLGEVAVRLAECGRFRVIQTSFHTPSTSDALRQALDNALGTSGRSALMVRHAVTECLRRVGEDDPAEVRDLVTFLRPEGDERIEQGRMFALVHRTLLRLSRSRPVLLAIDDLHKGGADAAAFFDYLLFQASFEPFSLFIVATLSDGCKSDTFRGMLERSARFEGSVRHTFHLKPLDPMVLARGLVSHLGLSPTRARQIARGSDGNPLYAVLMARAGTGDMAALDDTGVVGGGQTGLSGTAGDTGEQVPPALRDMLELSMRRQLERSGASERLRALLESVAVLGAAVDVSLLEAFLEGDGVGDSSRAQLDDDLDRCLDLDLLSWSEVDGAEVVSFMPAVARTVMLAGLNPRRARRLHRRAIDVRTGWASSCVDAEAGALGDHADAIGQTEEAISWWLRGQDYERFGGDSLRSVEWGLKALAAMDASDPRHGACAITLGRTLLDAGDLRRAEEMLRVVVEAADTDLAMRAGDVLGDLYENRGGDAEWTALIESMSVRESEATSAGLPYLYAARSMWLNYHGRREEAVDDATRALALAAPGEQSQRAAQRLGFLRVMEGDIEAAEELAERALSESNCRSDLKARSLRLRGIVALCRGDYAAAYKYQDKALQLARRAGLITRIVFALIDLSDVLGLQERIEESLAKLQKAERMAIDLGMAAVLEAVRYREIVAAMMGGEREGMLERITALRADVVGAGVTVMSHFYDLLEAWAHLQRGELGAALDAVERAGDLSVFPHHPRFAELLARVGEELLTVSREQPLSGHTAERLRSVMDSVTGFARRFPETDIPARCSQMAGQVPAAS